MTDTLQLSIVLMVCGLGLILGEIFLASSGVASFLAASCIIASVLLAFYYHGPYTGTTFLGAAIFGVPCTLAFAVWLLPYTPVGRHILAPNPTEEEVLPMDGTMAEVRKLVGKIGTSATVMLPSGVVDVDGKSYEAVSDGEVIEAGQFVKVIDVQTHRLVVRKADESPRQTPQIAREPGDPLGKSLEELGLDPFSDPLA